ncbi:MAG: HAMP domain-containing protein [Candidatus Aminicenantes bacterium]|nr:HAMP domain-containing protein [Candidatus Aminicenantes bacterium]
MKLKKKIYILHGLIATAILIVFFLFYSLHFKAALTKLKRERTDILVNGVQTLLEKEISRVTLLCADNAGWDTMYRYVSNPNIDLEKDMAPDLFIKYMKLSLFSVINIDLDIIFLTGYDRITDQKIYFDQIKNKKGELWDFTLESYELKKSHNHLINTKYGVMVLVSSPIIRSDGSGAPRGRFLLGNILDKNFFLAISNTLGEKVRYRTRDFVPESSILLLSRNGYKLYETEDNLEILKDIYDSHNEYAYTLGITASKNFSLTFKKIIIFYSMGLIFIFITAAIVIYLFFNKFILKNIESISEKTSRIVTSDDLSIVFPVSSNDEICMLKRNLNDMLKRMKKEIRKTLDVQNMLMLNEKMIFLGNITANIAHEMINPLFAVSNAVEYIRNSDCCNDEKLIEALKIIENETARVREIAMNLNRYSIHKSMTFSETDLNDIIDAAIMVAKWSRSIDKITFKRENVKNKLNLFCNPGAIQQVFINLIINSIDALMGKGDITINISGNELGYTIDFIDDGPGFTKAIINNAFDSFKSTKNGKGAGLGLYISYNIIKDHGGTIRIDSEYKNGSHIIITIPNKGVLRDGKSD